MSPKTPLRTRRIENQDDIRRFFDEIAADYGECHGAADRLLEYRLRIIRGLLPQASGGSLLEIGCGTGAHLFGLAGEFARVIGTDLSPGMIARAERLRQRHPLGERIVFRVDSAEQLQTLAADEIDVVLCVGALEHMPDKPRVLEQVERVLKPGGVFICLTPNADYLWYRRLATMFGYATRHLSSDAFLSRSDLSRLLQGCGLIAEHFDYWTFIPKGDMPTACGLLLTLLDGLGKLMHPGLLRGGIACRARKPMASRSS